MCLGLTFLTQIMLTLKKKIKIIRDLYWIRIYHSLGDLQGPKLRVGVMGEEL
jgi:hypothetical protein